MSSLTSDAGCGMSRHMRRTTVRLDEGLLDLAKREAQRRGETLTSLIEQGLRHELQRPKAMRPTAELPIGHPSSSPPGLDMNSNAAVLAFLDEGVPLDKLR